MVATARRAEGVPLEIPDRTAQEGLGRQEDAAPHPQTCTRPFPATSSTAGVAASLRLRPAPAVFMCMFRSRPYIGCAGVPGPVVRWHRAFTVAAVQREAEVGVEASRPWESPAP